jgi:hypothetical protein
MTTGNFRFLWLPLLLLLAGCQLYWTKPGSNLSTFTNDHHACIKTAGVSAGEEQLLVNLDLYRACLKGRGWQRETGSKISNPPGYFRGQEEEGPVRIGEVPRQVPTMERPR